MAALSPAEQRDCVELLARAFRDNPLNQAVIASPSPTARLRANRHSIAALLPQALAAGTVRVARDRGQLVGVLLGAAPGAFPLPAPPILRRLRSVLGQGIGVALRWGRVFERLLALHPPWPHAYLATLGVDPEAQGRGVGAGLVADWLREVDAAGTPAYLETDRERNLPLYVRAGFHVWAETEILGTRIWQLHRDGRRAGPEGQSPV